MRDELFLSNGFFDPRDLFQVRYEMLRRVREDGVPVSHAAASFGVSRPTWYQAQRAWEAGGLPGLLPDRPGPRRPHKLSDEVVEALQTAKSKQLELTAAALVELVRERFGISIHRSSIDRALARGKNDDDAQPAVTRRAPRGGTFRLRAQLRADAPSCRRARRRPRSPRARRGGAARRRGLVTAFSCFRGGRLIEAGDSPTIHTLAVAYGRFNIYGCKFFRGH